MKLALRDLFWLMLLIASLTAWVIDHSKAARQIDHLRLETRWLRLDRGAKPTDAELKCGAALRKLAKLTDDELDQHLSSLLADKRQARADKRHWDDAEYEPCLSEMARRGLASQLEKHYDALLAYDPPIWRTGWDFPDNLELLTALRRAQHKPDPFKIGVTVLDRPPYEHSPQGPWLEVAITNVDVDKESVLLFQGSGWDERWFPVLTNEHGQQATRSNYRSMSMGGGLGTIGPLAYGETGNWRMVLDARLYVAPPPSGKYRLQVLYHNRVDIVDDHDTSGLIVSKSEPIWITVANPNDPSPRRFDKAILPTLAVLAACSALMFVSIARKTPSSSPAAVADSAKVASISRPFRVPRRDLGWCFLIVALALGSWLDHRYQANRIAEMQSDANANWSMAPADDVKR